MLARVCRMIARSAVAWRGAEMRVGRLALFARLDAACDRPRLERVRDL